MTTASNSAAKSSSTLRAAAASTIIVSFSRHPIRRPGGVRRPGFSRAARPPEPPASVQAVKAERAAGHDLLPCRRRQWPKPVADHLRRARKEPVLMRIIGRAADGPRPAWAIVAGGKATG